MPRRNPRTPDELKGTAGERRLAASDSIPIGHLSPQDQRRLSEDQEQTSERGEINRRRSTRGVEHDPSILAPDFVVGDRDDLGSRRQADFDDPFDPDAWSEEQPAPELANGGAWNDSVPSGRSRLRRDRRGGGSSRGRPPVERTAIRRRRSANQSASAILSRASLFNDRIMLAMIGASLVSLAALAAVVASQANDGGTVITTHVSASGMPDQWGTGRTLWRLPLIAAMILVINLIMAWPAAVRDRFAARFFLGAVLVVHLVLWVALIDLV